MKPKLPTQRDIDAPITRTPPALVSWTNPTAILQQAIDLAKEEHDHARQMLSQLELAASTIQMLLDHAQLDLFGQAQVSPQYGEARKLAHKVLEIIGAKK